MSIADEADKNKITGSGSAADANEGLTILRIKRRRNEEPLDTLGNLERIRVLILLSCVWMHDRF